MMLRRHATVTVAMLFLFWAIAVILVVATDRIVAPISLTMSVSLKVVAIIVTAYAYMRLAARNTSFDSALFGGAAWAILTIITELIATTNAGHGWFALMGSPQHGAQRELLLLAWIAAPALLARNRA